VCKRHDLNYNCIVICCVCCICRWDEEDVVLNIFVSLYIKYVVSVVVRVGMCERENPCGTQKVFFFKDRGKFVGNCLFFVRM